ncbi:PucR family transcriptional regulator [Actinomadura sp. 21ATH]|uniref:PucR family transcriptional regulator n=1 Tax=Actinomadura sp. 21ATH TaxID=1735444 RepID=UPI0035BFC332
MPPTLGKVAALPGLGLRPLTEVPRDAPVRWVAVSELEDPTPFLEGGELVLTVGMRLTPGNAGPYVTRLVERGVAGLGFAVGVIHPSVPPELLAAARAQGLALLEVPRPTPFIAVGKAVSRLLAAEEYRDVTRSFQAQRELTRAALKGPGTLIVRLARELDGWALLLDPAGAPRHAEPSRARRHAGHLAEEIIRLRPSGGGPVSIALAGADGHVVAQSIGLGGRPRGYLVVGTEEPLPPAAHTIVGAAVSLLTLQLESPRSGRRVRAALGGVLLGVRPPGAALPEPPLRVLACGDSGGAVLDALEADPVGERCLAVPVGDFTAVIVPDRLAGQAAAPARTCGPVGVSGPVPDPESLPGALEQAGRALAAARRVREGPDSPYGLMRYEDLPGQGLLGLLRDDLAEGFADALLAPLRAEDPALVASLRAYLAANGQGEAAARALGVHRHTLRARMRKTAELLHRDLDDPAVRAELWVALAVAANRDTPIGHAGGFPGGPAGIA